MSDIQDPVTEYYIDQELDGSDGVPDSSMDLTITRKGNSLVSEDVVGMEAFTDIMVNKNITTKELQSRLAMKFNLLVCTSEVNILSFYNTFMQTRYADSIGLNFTVGLLPSGSSGVSSISGPM